MKTLLLHEMRSQSGFTLIELLVASAIGVIVMTGLTSVVFTTWRAGSIATGRIEASSQIRNFQFDAYDDFALSGVPVLNGCSGSGQSCTITLSGLRASNSASPAVATYTVTYTWNGTSGTPVDRQFAGGTANHAAINVTSFSAFLAGTPPNQTVVVTLSVTVLSYTETQTLLFYPRVNP